MNLLWQSFLKNAARQSSVGSVRDLGGVEAAWVHSALVINNGAYLTGPVADEGDWKARLEVACEDARPHGLPWAFYLYEPYAASVDTERVVAVAGELGLAPVMGIRVMVGDAETLQPPARSLPGVEFRRVTGRDEAAVALNINMRSYGMPEFMTDSVLETGAYFSDAKREFGFVAYVDNTAVSTTTVVELDGWLYVALVATDPDHRQKGYAEAVMRHALSEAAGALGVTRSALDASAMGAPLYEQMGYRFTGESWTMYAPSH